MNAARTAAPIDLLELIHKENVQGIKPYYRNGV